MHVRVLIFLAALLLVACSDETAARTSDAGADVQPDAGACSDAGTRWVECYGYDAAHSFYYELEDESANRNHSNTDPVDGDETSGCDNDPVHGCNAEGGEAACLWNVEQRGGRGGKPFLLCDCDIELTDHRREQYCDGD